MEHGVYLKQLLHYRAVASLQFIILSAFLTSTVVTLQSRTAKVRLINLVCHRRYRLCIRHLSSWSFCCYWNFSVGENWKLLVSLCCPSWFVLSSYKTAFPMFAWHVRQQPRRDLIGIFELFYSISCNNWCIISALSFSSPPKATSGCVSRERCFMLHATHSATSQLTGLLASTFRTLACS